MQLLYAPILVTLLLFQQPPTVPIPTVKVPTEARGLPGAFITVRGTTTAQTGIIKYVGIDPGLNVFPSDLLTDKTATVVSALIPGRYRLLAYTGDGGGPSEPAVTIVIIGTPGPPEPGPGPGPNPVPPNPSNPYENAGTNPYKGMSGLRVMMIYESEDLSKIPSAQYNVLVSQEVRTYLNSKCPIGPDGKTREFRVYDKDQNLSADFHIWKDVMARARNPVADPVTKIVPPNVPWLVVGDGMNWYDGPLPSDVPKMMELLKKYGQ